jgi:L-ascorbate metabolism protein UlaG (beta-lactamase superfamily)
MKTLLSRVWRFSRLLAIPALAAGGMVAAAVAADERIASAGGEIVIRPLAHASVELEFGGRIIQIDPWSVADLNRARPADLVLVTDADDGGHHLDPAAISRLRKPGAPVVIPAAGHTKFPDGVVLANGDKRQFADIEVQAIAAYDLSPGEPFHPKGKASGYVLTLGTTRVYAAGVTECVPEMRALENIRVAFMPMNLPQGRMAPAAVAECVRAFKPAIVFPYHYDQTYIRRMSEKRGQPQAPEVADSVRELAKALSADGIEVRTGDWYPAR